MSGIFFGGAPGRILRAWQDGRVNLVASPEIVEEYLATAEALANRYPAISLESILALVVRNAEIWKSRALRERVCTDPDDDKFLACALASQADCIVSGDKSSRRVTGYEGVQALSPRRFVDAYPAE